jgi:membrane protein involved in colicin uptake
MKEVIMPTAAEAKRIAAMARQAAEKKASDEALATAAKAKEDAPARARYIIAEGERRISLAAKKGFSGTQVMDRYTDLTSCYAAAIVSKHFEDQGYKVEIKSGLEGNFEYPTSYDCMVVSWE